MKCTFLKPLSVNREYTEAFGGYDHRARIADGCFADMKNLSSHAYPLMATRRVREVLMKAENLQGVLVKDKAAWVAGGKLFYDGKEVEGLTLSEGDKTLISMGARVIISPDMASYNTVTGQVEMLFAAWIPYHKFANYCDNETLREAWDSAKRYTYLPDGEPLVWGVYEELDEDGNPILDDDGNPIETEGYMTDTEYVPMEGDYAKENSDLIYTPLYRYTGGNWELEKTDLITLEGAQFSLGELKALKKGDSLRFWIPKNMAEVLIGEVVSIDKINQFVDVKVPRGVTADEVKGLAIDYPCTPILDGLMENGNRLWGWRYGEAMNGETVNEIYSTALGDPRAWNVFEGIASDSYVVGVGSDGPFTGAVCYSGSMYFFKENCFHRVIGKKPANYQLTTTTCTGVERGSEKSLVVAAGSLYYKGEDGFYRYDGSLPYKISDALGDVHYKNAVGGVLGDFIYWDCETGDGRVMLVYDLAHKFWYKESSLGAKEMVPAFGNLVVRSEDGLYLIDGADVDGRFGEVFAHEGEGQFEWFGEFGDLGLSDVNAKYVSRLVLRTTVEKGARVNIELMRDSSGSWETVAVINAKNKETSSVPITVPRCDHFRIRIGGVGGFKLWGLARDIEKTNEIRR